MPAFRYNCENFPYCDQYVVARGDKCDDCQRREQNETKNWRGRGWSRYSNNKDAKPGHKGEGKNK